MCTCGCDNGLQGICNCVDSCHPEPCGCTTPIFSDCVYYSGGNFKAINVPIGGNLTEILSWIDNWIHELDTMKVYRNIGDGEGIYAGTDIDSTEMFKSLKSSNTTMLKLESTNEVVSFTTATYDMSYKSGIISFLLTSAGGFQVTQRQFDIRDIIPPPPVIPPDTNHYIANTNWVGSKELQLVYNKELPNLSVDFSRFKNLNNARLVGNNLELTLDDGTQFNVDLGKYVNPESTQSDVLERNVSSPAYIKNQNPVKTVNGSYNLTNNDNSYVIEIDNGATDVVINASSVTAINNFFVGFIQKGTGKVTFNGIHTKPSGKLQELKGQGYQCAIEIINNNRYLFGGLANE